MMLRTTAALLIVAAAATAQADVFQASVKTQTLKVGHDRLVAMVGGSATDSAKVFAIPSERFKNLADTPGSGVTFDEVTFVIHGMKGRLDQFGPQKDMSMIFDFDKNVILFLRHRDKQYREWKVPPGSGQPNAKGQLRPLEKSAKINGFDAKAFELKDSSSTALIWVSREHPDFAKFYRRLREAFAVMRSESEASKDQAVDLAAAHGLPVLIQFLGPDGYRREEILSVQTKSIPPTTFSPPDDYKRAAETEAQAPVTRSVPSPVIATPTPK